MKISELAAALEMEGFQTELKSDLATDCYVGDLLSDVMANAPENSVFVTIQAHTNTIAVCLLAGINAVFVANGRPIPSDMIAAAAREGIGIYRSSSNQYQLAWKIKAAFEKAN